MKWTKKATQVLSGGADKLQVREGLTRKQVGAARPRPTGQKEHHKRQKMVTHPRSSCVSSSTSVGFKVSIKVKTGRLVGEVPQVRRMDVAQRRVHKEKASGGEKVR